jgi:hypothetical protein
MDVVSTVLPLASTLIGAGITYAINVRVRRRTYQDDLVNSAIAAVAAAEASIDFIATVTRPVHMTAEDFGEFERWLVAEGMKTWATKVAQANQALARVLPYKPGLEPLLPFKPDAGNRGTHEAIIAVLRATGSSRPD